jgi:hypothetical protein
VKNPLAIQSAVLVLSSLAAGCGNSGDEPTGNGTSGGDTPVASEECLGHRVGDACMTDANFAECRAREAECPGEVLELESCPLQFRCPSSAATTGDCAYEIGDACITEENLAQCREMAQRCPGHVLALESCPLQFACPG